MLYLYNFLYSRTLISNGSKEIWVTYIHRVLILWNARKLFKNVQENFVIYLPVFCPNAEEYGVKKPGDHGGLM